MPLTESLIDLGIGRPPAYQTAFVEERAQSAKLILASGIFRIVDIGQHTHSGELRDGNLVTHITAHACMAGLETPQALNVVDVQVLVYYGYRLVTICRVGFFLCPDLIAHAKKRRNSRHTLFILLENLNARKYISYSRESVKYVRDILSRRMRILLSFPR